MSTDYLATADAETILDLIAAEFESDPTSVQCFDLRVVARAVALSKAWRAERLAHRRLELVVLDIIHNGAARTGAGFGQYPLGVRAAVEALLPFLDHNDPAWPALERAWTEFLRKLTV